MLTAFGTNFPYFEDGDDGQGHLMRIARREGFNTVPQSKADIRAFDPCDLAGWKARTAIDDGLVKLLGLRGEFEHDRFVQANNMLRVKGLLNTCRELGIEKRIVS